MSRMVRFSVGALLATAIAAQTPVLRKGVSVQMPVTTNAVAMPDADLAERAGRDYQERTARPGDARDPARLRAAPVGGGRAYAQAHPAAGQPVVHRRPRRETRAGAHDPDADVGEGRYRHVDGAGRDYRGPCAAAGRSRGLRDGRTDDGEGRLAATSA